MTEILIMLVAVTGAGFIQSAAGFGSALVAMPILTILLGVRVSAPVVSLQGLIISSTVLIQNWRGLDFKEASRLILASFLGVPLGIWALKNFDEESVTVFLGLVLVVYALYNLYTRLGKKTELESPGEIPQETWPNRAGTWLAGFASGILGGAYNTNGPPLIIYGAYKHWPKTRFKSILQSLFLSNGLLIVVGHATAGSLTSQVWRNFAYSVPALILGIWIGSKLDKRLNPGRFRQLVLCLILLLGLSLLVL